jgi:7-carboxy-7-deazaguanine synthase
MRISEIFHSIQGEGELTGVSSVFVRTIGCNLRCRWCDTAYAWTGGEDLPIDQIVAQVQSFPARHVVLTGGEPLVASGIHELAQRLHDLDKHITLETSGTVAPNGIKCSLASLSPKLSNSVPLGDDAGGDWAERHERTRLQPAILREWLAAYPYQLKFVVESESDLAEIADLLRALQSSIRPERVLLMPQGTDREELAKRAPFVVAACKQYGYRYCTRLHVDLFGNRKGV